MKKLKKNTKPVTITLEMMYKMYREGKVSEAENIVNTLDALYPKYKRENIMISFSKYKEFEKELSSFSKFVEAMSNG